MNCFPLFYCFSIIKLISIFWIVFIFLFSCIFFHCPFSILRFSSFSFFFRFSFFVLCFCFHFRMSFLVFRISFVLLPLFFSHIFVFVFHKFQKKLFIIISLSIIVRWKDPFHCREKINAELIHMDNTGISVSFVNLKDKHLMRVSAFKKLREK